MNKQKLFKYLFSIVLTISLVVNGSFINLSADTNKYNFSKDNIKEYNGPINKDFIYQTVNSYNIKHPLTYDDAWFNDYYSYTFNYDIAQFMMHATMGGFGNSNVDQSKNVRGLFDVLGYTYVDRIVSNETSDSSDSIVYPNGVIAFDYKDDTKDVIGSAIAYKNVKFEDGSIYTNVAVILRGSGYDTEWASNLTVGTSGNHSGFEDGARVVEERVKDYLSNINTPYPINIWVTSYSRGAAVANILAHKLNSDALDGTIKNVKPENIFAYTYETPNGVYLNDVKDVKYTFNNKSVILDNNIFNLVNPIDLVPEVVMKELDFGRYGLNKMLPSSITTPDYYNSTYYNNMVNAYKGIYEYAGSGYSFKVNEVPSLVKQEYNQRSLIRCYFNRLAYVLNNDRNVFVNGTNLERTLRMILGNDYLGKEISEVSLYYKYNSSTSGKITIDIRNTDNLNYLDLGTKVLSLLTRRASGSISYYYLDISMVDEGTNNNKTTETVTLTSAQFEKLFAIVPEDITDISISGLINGSYIETLEGYGDYYSDLLDTVTQAHYPDLGASWFDGNDELMFKYERYNKVVVSASGTVNVTYKDNNVSSLNNGSVVSSKLEAYIDDSGNKVVLVPDDSDYKINIALNKNDNNGKKIHVETYNMNTGDYLIRTLDYSLNGSSSGDNYVLNISRDNQSLTKNGGDVSLTKWEDENGDKTDVVVNVVGDPSMGSVSGSGRYPVYTNMTLKASANDGYVFDGFYNEHNKLITLDGESVYLAKDNETITGKFTPQVYNITYVLDDGTNSVDNPETYTILSEDTTLYPATKEKYKFDGWYLENTFETKITEIDISELKDITLYAKFIYDGMIIDVESFGYLEGQTLFVDGIPQVVAENNTIDTSSSAKIVIYYDIENSEDSDVHNQYPNSMKVYSITNNEDGTGTLSHLDKFDNILGYEGTSIRITGKKGIRVITSIPLELKNSLMKSNVDGYQVMEYGTLMSWAKDIEDGKDLTLAKSVSGSYEPLIGKKGRAYDRKDNYYSSYKETSSQSLFTNTLVGNYTDEQIGSDVAFRPYIVLSNGEEEIVLYGGTIRRSIAYVAYRNMDTFKAGSDSYEYIWSLIKAGYGDKYDEYYQHN